MSPFDRKLVQKSSVFTAIAIAVALGIGVITDEPGNTARQALARLFVLVPALGTLGSALALAYARARGELRPLEALGARPFRVVLPALATAWVFALGAAFALSTSLVESSVLFPAIPGAPAWELGETGARAPGLGIEIAPDGFVVQSPQGDRSVAEPTSPLGSEHPAGWLLLPLAILLPPWGIARLNRLLRLVSGGVTLGLQIVLFHLTALAAVSPLLPLLSAAPLGAALALHLTWRR